MQDNLLVVPNEHDSEITNIFAGRVAYEGDVVFDHPLYLLAFTNRCGSNLLADYMNATQKFSGFAERLNFDVVAADKADLKTTSFPEHIGKLLDGLSKPQGVVPGFKAAPEQIQMLFKWSIHKMFPSVRLIHIKRQDLIAQAVSMSIAYQTKQWSSELPKFAEAKYNFSSILTCLNYSVMGNARIEYFSSLFRLPRLEVCYESLVQKPEIAVRRIADFSGVSLGDWQPSTPRISKQDNAEKRQFVARFRVDSQARVTTSELA